MYVETRQGQYEAGGYDGVGVVLTDGIAGVDLDHALDDDGVVAPWAHESLSKFANTYREKSPSGRGFRIFARGVPRRSGKGGPEKCIEVYGKGSPRFLTVTGCALDDVRDVHEAQDALDWLHDAFMASPEGCPATPPAAASPLMGDDEVLARARKADNGKSSCACGPGGMTTTSRHPRRTRR